ncbi:MAG: glycosyltransferase family 9 protein, partial [Chloroflexota bacterium]|nr:glycosyltransferase family 9 protein [Chloroflexota bacterium]
MDRLGQPPPRRVAVLRALQLGDLLCAVPALRALRGSLPEAEIVLIGLPWARSFVERFDRYLDRLLELPGYPGLPERPPRIAEIPGFLATAQGEEFDLAVQMHGSGGITNPLTVLLGARVNAGFFVPGDYCPDPARFLAYPEHAHEVRRHLRLLEFLGVPLRGEGLEFPLHDEDLAALRVVDAARGLRPGEYACIHPGARAPGRRWPPERFAAVADALAARGLVVVLTGSAEEAALTRAVADAMDARPVDLAGRTSLGALAALLTGARLLVCNDTGVSHVAAALRVPSVVIFTGSDPNRWAPLDRDLHRVIAPPAGGRSPDEASRVPSPGSPSGVAGP